MISLLPTRNGTAVLLLMPLILLLPACAPTPIKNAEMFNKSEMKLIKLNIERIDAQALGISTASQDMAARIQKNLIEWGYPIEIKDDNSYTHTLNVSVNPVEHQASTPTGFSFSSGNSDPRAIDFQKTDVLPVNCELTSIAHPEQSAPLSMSFTANATAWLGNKDRYVISSDKLVDHISTVCFNLLSDLKWPNKKQSLATPAFNPSWMPEIRIETIEEQSPAKPLKPLTIDASKTSQPAESAQETESVETSETKEGRKQIIIHNQGTPVIIKFGYERQ